MYRVDVTYPGGARLSYRAESTLGAEVLAGELAALVDPGSQGGTVQVSAGRGAEVVFRLGCALAVEVTPLTV